MRIWKDFFSIYEIFGSDSALLGGNCASIEFRYLFACFARSFLLFLHLKLLNVLKMCLLDNAVDLVASIFALSAHKRVLLLSWWIIHLRGPSALILSLRRILPSLRRILPALRRILPALRRILPSLRRILPSLRHMLRFQHILQGHPRWLLAWSLQLLIKLVLNLLISKFEIAHRLDEFSVGCVHAIEIDLAGADWAMWKRGLLGCSFKHNKGNSWQYNLLLACAL